MSFSVVLRLRPEPLLAGRLAGEVEFVTTGRRRVISNTDELVAFVCGELDAEHENTERSEDDAAAEGGASTIVARS